MGFEATPSAFRETVLLEHAGDCLGQGGAEGGGDGLLRLDGAMEVAQLARGVGGPAGGLEPTLEHGGGAGPLGPIAVGGVGGLDERVQLHLGDHARQRLHAAVAAERDLVGRDVLQRAADAIRDLARGEFLALGPAITRRPISVKIGGKMTEVLRRVSK